MKIPIITGMPDNSGLKFITINANLMLGSYN